MHHAWGPHAAKHAAAAAKPILGINLGRIGFVAGLEIDKLDKLKYLISGDYKVENRMLLKVTVHTGAEEREIYALNDAVVSRGSLSRMVDLSVSYTGSKVTQGTHCTRIDCRNTSHTDNDDFG